VIARLALVALLVVVAGCERELRGLQCNQALQCAPGFFCDTPSNLCFPVDGCAADEDCGEDGACVSGACISRGGFDCSVCDGQNRECEPDIGECRVCLPGFFEVGAAACEPDTDCSPEGQTCSVEEGCCEGLDCRFRADVPEGECADATTCLEQDFRCEQDPAGCCGGLVCDANSGCVPEGTCRGIDEGCDQGDDCCSGTCAAGLCVDGPLCLDGGQGQCQDDTSCCAGFACSAEAICRDSCNVGGGDCGSDLDCCLGSRCEANLCVDDGATGTPCTVTADCPAAFECVGDDAGFGLVCKLVDLCGNGVLDDGETCDNPDTFTQCTDLLLGNGEIFCDSVCQLDRSGCDLPSACGNGVTENQETCDTDQSFDCSTINPARNDFAGCADACHTLLADVCCDADQQYFDGAGCADIPGACGNGFVDDGNESCDDGNRIPGDGCSAGCQIENKSFCNISLAPTLCQIRDGRCGDLTVTQPEDCDPPDGDQCNDVCGATTCGDGIINQGEECDDGNTVGGDGCEANCTVDPNCGYHYAQCANDNECCNGLQCDTSAGRCRF
jgi:cysteine-rich repeat protein